MTNPHLLQDIQFDVVENPLPADIIVDHKVRIPLRDGVSLAASLYRPATGEPTAVIIAISPYGKENFQGIGVFANVPNSHIGHIEISDSVSFEAPDPGFWVPNGYAVLQVDVRGQGVSEGDTEPLGPTEQADYCEIIEWAAKQPWSSGSVGLLGVSYLAITQWAVAQHRPPALKAIVPWEAFTDQYLQAYPGGIPEVGMWKFVLNDFILPNHNPACGIKMPPPGYSPADHPLRNGYWDAQRIRIEDVDVPVLLCASFSDQGLHSKDSFDNFELVSHDQKWMFSHRRPKWDAFYSEEARNWQLSFFDQFLKERTGAFESFPRIRFDVHESRNTYTVRTSDAWPPHDSVPTVFYLNASDETLGLQPSAAESYIEYDAASGSAHFDLKVTADMIAVGHSKLKLWIEVMDGDDADLFACVQKIDREGNHVYFYGFGGTNPNDVVSRGWLRASHRELDNAASRPDKPVHTHRREQKLHKKEIVPVEIELLPAATQFREGETLRVLVQGRAILPDAVLLEFKPFEVGTIRIWTGGEYNSQILTNVIK